MNISEEEGYKFVESLQVDEVFVEFDGPKLFSAVSADGQRYFANLVDDDDASETYLYVPVTSRLYREILHGVAPLRAAFLGAVGGVAWVVVLSTLDSTKRVKEIRGEQILPAWLPSPSSYLVEQGSTEKGPANPTQGSDASLQLPNVPPVRPVQAPEFFDDDNTSLIEDPDISDVVRHLCVGEAEIRKLANDPSTRAFIAAGIRLIDRELGVGLPGVPGHLEWLSMESVATKATELTGRVLTTEDLDIRWASYGDYLADLVSYALWSRRWGHDVAQADKASSRLRTAVAGGDVVRAVQETAYEDLMALVETPAYRFQIIAATTADVYPVVRAALRDMYRVILDHWTTIYEQLLGDLGLSLRHGRSFSEMADMLAATAEGVGVRLLADPESSVVDHEERTSVLGTVALSLLVSCIDLGDGNSLEDIVRLSTRRASTE